MPRPFVCNLPPRHSLLPFSGCRMPHQPLLVQLFFDNERWNCQDVSHLGVTCVYTPQGMTRAKWLQGLKEHAQLAVC